MKENHISFEPFRLDKSSVDALDIIVGITPHYGFLSKKGCDYIDKKLSDNIGKISANLNPLQSFLELFYITLKEICEEQVLLLQRLLLLIGVIQLQQHIIMGMLMESLMQQLRKTK